jgi:uncharacterized protein (TIGR03437 family)
MKMRALTILSLLAWTCGFAQNTDYNPSPLREFGQPRLSPIPTANPNRVEGRELFNPQSVAVDATGTPPILYVADTQNNRILAWKDANAFTKGDAADLVIGQADRFSTLIGGPGTSYAAGLNTPGGLAVDSAGNLYVVDAGNNRILRFPKPFSHTDLQAPDLVIGQAAVGSGKSPNEGQQAPSEKTVATTSGNNINTTALSFDAQGNLWFADTFNNRVLRYPAAALAAGAPNQPVADVVLGQINFSSAANVPSNSPITKTGFTQPSSLAFAGNDLYAGAALGRVLYFRAPLTSSKPAARILGVYIWPQGQQPAVNDTTMTPLGLATLNNNLYVADASGNRIMKFDVPTAWAAECIPSSTNQCGSNGVSPAAIAFIGQPTPTSSLPNQGQRDPSAGTLSSPSGLTFVGTDLYVADSGNNRVLVLPASGGSYAAATRVLGQLDFNTQAPNLIEGREVFLYARTSTGAIAGGGIAVDSTSNPPHLYVADTLNNRILGFRDIRNVGADTKADIVIGQLDFLHNTPNANGNTGAPSEWSLFLPTALAIDRNGDLFVADRGNGRVLRFPQPFSQTGLIKANLVLGKPDFYTNPANASDPTDRTMAGPSGVAFSKNGTLLVSDAVHSRVIEFQRPAGGDFTSGQAAFYVLGQPNMNSSGGSSDPDRLNAPQGIALDGNDRVYVADTGNNRVNVFAPTDTTSRFRQSVNSPYGVAVNQYAEVWVTDFNGAKVHRFPIFETWQQTGQELSNISTGGSPVSIALDGDGNPIVGEAINRVSFYYIAAAFRNSASYVIRALAPGMLANLYRYGPSFAPGTQAVAQSLPWPNTLGDVQVLFNGKPTPLYYVDSDRVSFQVPYTAPTSGAADVELIRPSTGQILAAGTFPMHASDPGFYTLNAQGTGQIAALNQDGSVNGPTNPAPRGSYVSLYGTGIGAVDSAPADGQAAAGPLPATGHPLISMSPGGSIDDSNIQYWGLAPGLPGVWQLNLKIPDAVPPGSTIQVAFFWHDWASNDGPSGKLQTTIAVK